MAKEARERLLALPLWIAALLAGNVVVSSVFSGIKRRG
jgi:hypothetical protein